MLRKILNHKISSFRIIIFGFILMILIGTGLLCLPFAASGSQSASFSDALFTATSAVCVTGLVVQDTATYWSPFGQAVIILLIQAGGLGVVTVAAVVSIFSGRKIGLLQRETMQESISAPEIGGIVRITRFAFIVTLVIEAAGAVLLCFVFIPEYGLGKGLWYAVFHSISAFCNAGFDLMGEKAQFSSLTSYASDPVLNIVIMLLIILGGLGFLTWDDIRTNKLHFRKYKMQSKVILSVSGILIILPALFFFFAEFSGLPMGERVLKSLFQSVTARTAGFNTADFSGQQESSLTVMIVLMLIGGSPGSTAGGMKTTTVAVLFGTAVSIFRKRDSAEFFGRKVPDDVPRKAAALLIMYIFFFVTGGVIVSIAENVPILAAFFETGSAVATVGLSLGLTPQLSLVSRIVIMILMYIGRVGGLTIIYATHSVSLTHTSKYPQENITVG